MTWIKGLKIYEKERPEKIVERILFELLNYL